MKRWTQRGGATTQGARLCPPRTSRSGPESPQAPVGISSLPWDQPAAAGAPRTQPCSGKNPRGALEFCRVVVQRKTTAGIGPGSHQAVNQYRPVNSWFPLYYNSSKSSRAARILPLRCQSAEHRRIVSDAGLLVPEGRRRKLAGGKPAPAGAAPGCHAKRAMPQRGIGEVFGVARPALFRPPLVASGRSGRQRATSIPGHFFDAPLGHGATRNGFRGRRPLARTCPRLISSGVPPGREPGVHPLTKGNHWRGISVTNSLDCRSAALCSSCLGGPSVSARPNSYGSARRNLPTPTTHDINRINAKGSQL